MAIIKDFILFNFVYPADSSITIKTGGCFQADTRVRLSTGATVPIHQVALGDKVLATTPEGALVYSEVHMFLDVSATARATFVTIATESGSHVTLTPSHVVYVADVAGAPVAHAGAQFAGRVRAGQYVYVAVAGNATLRQSRVVSVALTSRVGFYAPLTKHGTIVADDVVASCYALFDSPTVAHWSFAPMRLYHATWSYFRRKLSYDVSTSTALPEVGAVHERPLVGVHWYAQMLHTLGRSFLGEHRWFTV